MRDFILQISFDITDATLDELVHAALFLTTSRGSTLHVSNGREIVSAYFDSAEERDAARSSFQHLDVDVRALERDRVDWLERYEQSLHAIEIGERFVVAPDAALLPRQSSRLPIIVPQEQAFGTGSHETTALCIAMLETLDLSAKRGLDIGTGSGILAIAMLRLGARKVIAFDNDLDAYGALRDNRMRNDVAEGSMPLFIGGIESLRGGTFDLITMNIIPEVIIALLAQAVARMSDTSRLIISGVLTERRDDVVSAARSHSLALQDERRAGEWWAGVFG